MVLGSSALASPVQLLAFGKVPMRHTCCMLCKGLCGRSAVFLRLCPLQRWCPATGRQCQCPPWWCACLLGMLQACLDFVSVACRHHCTGHCVCCSGSSIAWTVCRVLGGKHDLTHTWTVCWIVHASRVVGLHSRRASCGGPRQHMCTGSKPHTCLFGCFVLRSHTCSMVVGALHCTRLWTWCCLAWLCHVLQSTPELVTWLQGLGLPAEVADCSP